MEESYEYKYLKYKLKYLKTKYELEGGYSLFKSKLDKAMDKVYEKIAEYIETSAYKKGTKDIDYKTLKKNLKKIFTKNPLIGKTEQTNLKTAKKSRDNRIKSLKSDIAECKYIWNETNKVRKQLKIQKKIDKLTGKKADLDFAHELKILESGNINSKSFRLSNFVSYDGEVNKFKRDKKYNTSMFKKSTKIKKVTENELNLYITFWLMQSKFFKKLYNKIQDRATLKYVTSCVSSR
jgi:hypothetical protein